jgi:hypothetical protein
MLLCGRPFRPHLARSQPIGGSQGSRSGFVKWDRG